MPAPSGPARTLREVRAGVRLALAGLGAWAREPRLMLLGALPALVTALAMAAALAALGLNLPRIGHAVAGRLIGGDGWLEQVVAATAGLAVLVAALLLAVATYTSITLVVGQPFFESVSRRIDEASGAAPDDADPEPWARATLRGIGEGALTVAISLGVSLALLVLGLLPVIGSATAFAVGVVVGGRLLALELTAYPMSRRGVRTRRDRIRMLRPLRVRATAFGATVFLAFGIPLGAVVAMPAAVAGATMLARAAADARDQAAEASDSSA